MAGEEPTSATLIILSYNQEEYIAPAVQGALNQTYQPLQIIFSDDDSSDRTFTIINEIAQKYSGPHQLKLNRNEENLGLIDNLNQALSLSQGEIVIIGAGDDISFPNRTAEIVKHYLKNHRPHLLCSKAIEIDPNGTPTGQYAPNENLRRLKNIHEAVGSKSLYLGASGAWSRQLIEKYGPIQYKNSYEDLVMGFRALLEESAVFIDEPLLYYRVGNGLTTQNARSLTELIRKRKMQNVAWEDAIKQRRIDLNTSNIKHSEISKALEKELTKTEITNSIYNKPTNLIAHFKSTPPLTFRVLFSELYTILKLMYRNFINARPL